MLTTVLVYGGKGCGTNPDYLTIISKTLIAVSVTTETDTRKLLFIGGAVRHWHTPCTAGANGKGSPTKDGMLHGTVLLLDRIKNQNRKS